MAPLPAGVAVLLPAATCGLYEKVGTGRSVDFRSCFGDELCTDGVYAGREAILVLFADALPSIGGV